MTTLLERLNPFARRSRGATVPPMDGALKPNQEIEAAIVVLDDIIPDDLTWNGSDLIFTAGNVIHSMSVDGGTRALATFDEPLTALACDNRGGFAVGLASGGVQFGGTLESWQAIPATTIPCPTAMCFDTDGALLICNGSDHRPTDEWKRDLMERACSGSVWRRAFDGQIERMVDSLAWPHGVVPDTDGSWLISESWKSRLLRLTPDGKTVPVLEDLPGYPARITPCTDGFWLAIFAPRGQLIEFILNENTFRRRMIDTVAPNHWMAPALASTRDFQEPMQLGSLRTMGTLKPWAPTRSYGLAVCLDRQGQPVTSAHSRADGTRHGVTSVAEIDGSVFLACKGGEKILKLKTNIRREA